MKIRRGMEKKPRSVAVGAAVGVAAVLIMLLLGAAVTTTLYLNETLSLGSCAYISALLMLVSAFLGSLAAIKTAGQKYLLTGGITALAVLLLLVCGNVLVYDSQFSNFWLGAAAVLLGAALACVISAQGTGRKNKYKKMRSR